MRPTAPSFQINAPTEDDSSSVAAAPVMQVGAGDKRIARSSRPPRSKVPDVPRSAQQTAQRAAQQGPSRPSQGGKAPRVGASTMVMGSPFTAGSGATFAPAPYASPPGQRSEIAKWRRAASRAITWSATNGIEGSRSASRQPAAATRRAVAASWFSSQAPKRRR